MLQVSPKIIQPPISQSVTEGYPVNLSCVASGIPTPTFVWTFNNGDLPSGINQTDHEGESFLVSPSVTKGMNGTYKCTAKNKANTTSSSATLRVYGKFSYNDIDDDDDDDDEDDDDDDVDNDDDDDDDEEKDRKREKNELVSSWARRELRQTRPICIEGRSRHLKVKYLSGQCVIAKRIALSTR